jgi:CBS domain containing-hemolysin-like protein
VAVDGAFLSGFMLFVALFFVALNGLFVLAEFSFATIRGTQVEGLVNEGRASAPLVQEATRRLDAYLAVCQLGITISSLSLGALGEPAIADLIEPLFESAGMPTGLVHPVAFAVGFLIITSLHVVLGELVPKSIGIVRPASGALFIAPFIRAFYYLFLPLMVVFNGAGNAIVRAFGIPPASEKGETHTEEEVRMIIAQSGRHGILGAWHHSGNFVR